MAQHAQTLGLKRVQRGLFQPGTWAGTGWQTKTITLANAVDSSRAIEKLHNRARGYRVNTSWDQALTHVEAYLPDNAVSDQLTLQAYVLQNADTYISWEVEERDDINVVERGRALLSSIGSTKVDKTITLATPVESLDLAGLALPIQADVPKGSTGYADIEPHLSAVDTITCKCIAESAGNDAYLRYLIYEKR